MEILGNVCHQALAVNRTKVSPSGQAYCEGLWSLRNTAQIFVKKVPPFQTKLFCLKRSKREKSRSIPSCCRVALAPRRYRRVARRCEESCIAVSHLLPICCTHRNAPAVWKKSLQISVLARSCTCLVLDLSAEVVISNSTLWGWVSPCMSYFWFELWLSVQKGHQPCKYRVPALVIISVTITVLEFCFRHRSLQRESQIARMQLCLNQRYKNRKWILLTVHFIMLLMNYKMYIIKINILEIAS